MTDFCRENLWNFLGAPLTPHPKVFKTFKLPQVQLEFSRRPIFDTTSGWAGKNSQSFGLGGLPPKFGPGIFPNIFLVLADDESYVWKHFQEFLLRKFFFIRPFMFYPMPRLLKFRNYTLV